mmetsp:Transcript_33579/g.48721  ORF Transcript_33579/g.48721 Transcript_33579/m.48721 type:complete len:350 (-) Transcript_33579:125-1174(-)
MYSREMLEDILEHKKEDSHIENSILNAPNAIISKNQMKRNRREEYLKIKKKQRKEKEKIEKKEARELKNKLQYVDGVSSEKDRSDQSLVHSNISSEARAEKKEAEILTFLAKCESNFSIIIDCNWESNHSESALKSLSQQLMFCYSCNRHNSNPCRLFLSGVGPLIRQKLEKIHYDNWVGVSTHFKDILEVADGNLDDDNELKVMSWQGDKTRLVYLTSDAEEVIEDLDPNCCYIIGGIVDRNSLKGATLAKAKRLGIRTAQLPIKKHFALSATHVLTVNHVFEILLNVAKTGSWPQAIEKVLPKRKTPSRLDGANKDDTESRPTEECVKETDDIAIATSLDLTQSDLT